MPYGMFLSIWKKKIVESVSRIEGFQVGHDLAFLTRNNHL